MDFSSRQLRAFLLVAQHRSFTRAAEALFITPSGLSVLIRELETQLGFRLFDRTTRHVLPTAYGNEFLAVAQKSLAELDAATLRISRLAGRASQSLTLGAPPLMSANVLPQTIKEFRGHRPNLRIQLFDGSPTTILQMIHAGKLDMGVGVYETAPGIRRTAIFQYSLVVIRPDKDPAFHGATTTWSALRGARLISLRPNDPLQKVIDKNLARVGITRPPGISVNLLHTQIAMVEADEGIAVIPSFGLPACRNRKVVMSRLINPVVNMEFHQVTNRGKKLPPEADEFTSFLKSYIARWAGRAGVL